MPIDAVIFDWGGTLTRWHDVDFHAESLALARAVVAAGRAGPGGPRGPAAPRGRVHLGTVARPPAERDDRRTCSPRPGSTTTPTCCRAYYEFWEPHTDTDPEVGPLWEALRADGIKVGVLSNTIWPRSWHRGFFERDGVAHLIDGDVYTSEIPWTKPSPRAFRAAMDAVGVTDPARCVYVGDRLFDDVWGAHHAGMRAIHIPLSAIPAAQVGHTEGEPDAVAHALSDIPALLADPVG